VVFTFILLSMISGHSNGTNDLTFLNQYTPSKSATYFKLIKESETYLNSLKDNQIAAKRKGSLRFMTYPYLLFLSILFLLILIKNMVPDYFKDLFSGFTHPESLLSNLSQRKISLRISNILIDLSKLAIISLLLYEYLIIYNKVEYINIIYVLGGFTIIKALISYPFYYIFFGKNKINIQVKTISLFNRILFLFILPLVIISIYTTNPVKQIIIWITALIFIIFFIIRTFSIFLQIKNYYNYNSLYIFLYICIFEISLYFVFFKHFSENFKLRIN
jgi:hypothetical protein